MLHRCQIVGPKDGNIHPDEVDPEIYQNSNTLLMHGSVKAIGLAPL